MSTRAFATVLGVAFLVAGLAGFAPSPPPMGAPPLTVEHGHGLALGLFPVNILHNVVHLLFGVLGLLAGRAAASAQGYAKFVAVVYGLLTVLGLIPATQTTFGLIPIYGNDVWLHGAIAAAAAYFGFGNRGN
jgi:hypothetical protein